MEETGARPLWELIEGAGPLPLKLKKLPEGMTTAHELSARLERLSHSFVSVDEKMAQESRTVVGSLCGLKYPDGFSDCLPNLLSMRVPVRL